MLLKKCLFMILTGVIMLAASISMANVDSGEYTSVLSPDEIIIAEPVTDHVFNDKDLYITINIIDADFFSKLMDNPLTISLVKLEDTLPFADDLGEDLRVPVVKLSSGAAMEWLSTAGLTEEEYVRTDDKYTAETQIINQYFQQLEIINTLNTQINAAVSKYRFNAVDDFDMDTAEVSADVKEAYQTYIQHLSALAEQKRAFSEIQRKYLKLFEVICLKDTINSPSYLKDVGMLDEGDYRIRIFDASKTVIKELDFQVLARDKAINDMIADPISVEDKAKN
ncbi:hypothetical protein KHM83_10975 [Fusibacter paucivorans]|uniref:Uncharacterized protein n=1 Tax=Fusibacter paucivorans TaxID=76009 RepID=A0ABS5PPV5_9FIRM|nr:hypothetical protein [Fusibacter paucivorans]MBS7527203.1 hypothetical protein [Fusibacter paucivorans]